MAKLSPIGSEEWYMDLALRGVSRVYREHGLTDEKPIIGKAKQRVYDPEDDKMVERREETEELLSILYES